MIKVDQEEKVKIAENLLSIFSSILDRDDVPMKDDGNSIDTVKFNEMEDVKKLKQSLKTFGIDRSWLWDNGFMAAGLLLSKF